MEVNGRLMTSPMMTTRPNHSPVLHVRKEARRWTLAALAGMGMLALAGCAENDAMVAGCPNVGVLRDAGTLRTDQGVAILSGILANCGYDDTSVTIAANVMITARANEGASGGTIPVTYFVAVTDPNRNILSKKTFTTSVTVGSDTQETLTQVIPVPKTMDARWFEVLVGFQLTPEQVAANRNANEGR
jgi:ABC-type proline/glycine betaine transport system substrate-binding protein